MRDAVDEPGLVTVEFYGIARQRAGRASVVVRARTVGEALRLVRQESPSLRESIHADGSLAKHFLASVNGQRFVTSLEDVLRPGDHLLLLSADAGG